MKLIEKDDIIMSLFLTGAMIILILNFFGLFVFVRFIVWDILPASIFEWACAFSYSPYGAVLMKLLMDD